MAIHIGPVRIRRDDWSVLLETSEPLLSWLKKTGKVAYWLSLSIGLLGFALTTLAVFGFETSVSIRFLFRLLWIGCVCIVLVEVVGIARVGTLTITVTNAETGDAIAGATIDVVGGGIPGSTLGKILGSETTDHDGMAAIANLAYGYDLSVEKDGYATVARTIYIGRHKDIEIELEPI